MVVHQNGGEELCGANALMLGWLQKNVHQSWPLALCAIAAAHATAVAAAAIDIATTATITRRSPPPAGIGCRPASYIPLSHTQWACCALVIKQALFEGCRISKSPEGRPRDLP